MKQKDGTFGTAAPLSFLSPRGVGRDGARGRCLCCMEQPHPSGCVSLECCPAPCLPWGADSALVGSFLLPLLVSHD